jgi:iron complex transport system permease protein
MNLFCIMFFILYNTRIYNWFILFVDICNPKYKYKKNIIFVMITFFMFIFSIMFGQVEFNLLQIVATFFKTFSLKQLDQEEELIYQIFFFIRLPRSFTVVLCGAGLAVAGVLSQGLFKNALASPSVLGASQGAVFGALLAFYYLQDLSPIVFQLLSCASSFFATFMVLLPIVIFRLKTTKDILLIGLALSSLISAFNSVLLSLGIQDNSSSVMLKWIMGGFYGTQWQHFYFCIVVMLPTLILSYYYSLRLDILVLGDLTARSLGVRVLQTKIIIIILISLLVGTSICIAGGIPFVGLITAHLTRLVVGPKHKSLVFYSMFIGACLLLIADILARNLVQHREIELGILTALVGAPFFIFLIFKKSSYD